MFDSTGGGIHPSAIIGHPPELRDWRPGDACLTPDVHATARIHAFVTIDSGAERATTIGERTWLMKHVHVGHDTVIGNDCELAPGTVVGGHVTIGDRARLGINSTVRPGVTIGDGARIGCGAVVIKDVPSGEVWIGNPARRLDQTDVPKFGDVVAQLPAA